jgi:hypothetical protein
MTGRVTYPVPALPAETAWRHSCQARLVAAGCRTPATTLADIKRLIDTVALHLWYGYTPRRRTIRAAGGACHGH